jgi:hypothetical protein
MQSTFLRLTLGAAIFTGLLVTAAQSGQVRDHRSGASEGGVQTSKTPVVRDHRTGSHGTAVVHDHRSKPVVRDHRKPLVHVCVSGLFSTQCP